MSSFTCKAVFGLGITSLADFVQLVTKYKAAAESGVDYITATTFSLPKKKNLLVFDSVRELIRLHSHIKSHHVVVVSDTPVILKEINEVVPLDWDNNRSFEFCFKTPDIQLVLKALKSKQEVECSFVSYDNLGYHVNKIKGSGEMLNSYLSVTSSMPFDKRKILRTALVAFFRAKRVNFSTIDNAISQIGKAYVFTDDAKNFLKNFKKHCTEYHAAINSGESASLASKKFNVDQFSVAYFKKLLMQDDLNAERYKKHNVKLKIAR